MAVDVQTEIQIHRSVVDVATFSGNPDNAPKWYVNIKSVEWKSPKPLRVGSQIAFVAHFLGRRLAYAYEIIEYVPGEKLVMRTAEGPFPMETTYTWRAIDKESTEMTLRNRGTPAGFSKIFAPVMALAMRKANQNDLRMLKRLLEKRP